MPTTGLPSTPTRFGYTGQVWVPEAGLYYYKARMYSPTLGRFMQTDPIGYGDGMNNLAYVGNDPVNAIDPTGLECNGAKGGTQKKCEENGGTWSEIVVPATTYSVSVPEGWVGSIFGVSISGGGRYVGGSAGAGFILNVTEFDADKLLRGLTRALGRFICYAFAPDNGGDTWIAELGLTGGGQALLPAVGGNAGLAIDGFGNVGSVIEGGGGAGFGALGFGGVRGGVAIGEGIQALGGPALTSSATIAAIGGVSVDGFASLPGSERSATGVGIALGGGAGASASSMVSFTGVIPLFNLRSAAGC